MSQKCKNIVQTILNNNKYDEDKHPKMTHRAWGEFNGNFYLDESTKSDFMKAYIDAINSGVNDLTILEVQNEYSTILVDIDLECDKESYKGGRLYDNDLVLNIIEKYVSSIKYHLEDIGNFEISFLEKENPTEKEYFYKDGFHLFIHNICVDVDTRHSIRNKVVIECEEEQLFSEYMNNADKIIDKAVVNSNGWLLYGSVKPGGPIYSLTKKYKDDLTILYNHKKQKLYNDDKTIHYLYSTSQLINDYSVQSSYYNKSNENKKKVVIEKINKNKEDKPINNINIIDEELNYIMDNLNEERFNNYDDWLKMGEIFINCDLDLNIFDEYSKSKSPKKYNKSKNNNIIKGLKKMEDGPKIPTLLYYLKNDNKKAFNLLIKKIKKREELEKYNLIEFVEKEEGDKKNKIREAEEKLKELKKEELNIKYKEIKKDFELNNFKVNNPVSFVEIKDDNLIIRNRKDFNDRYENLILFKNDKDNSFVSSWLKDPELRYYEKIDFLPMQQVPDKVYNTFKGYEVINQPQNNLNIKESKIYNHLCNLCNNDNLVIDYVIKFLASKVQHPYKLTNTALIFRSTQGCGKDTLFNWFGNNILGYKYYLNESKIDKIFGHFNSSVNNKILVVVNETDKKDTIDLTSIIKNEITRNKNSITYKGKETFEQTNNISYVFFSNQKSPLVVESDDRRFVGIQCNNKIANNEIYFRELYDEIESKIYDKDFYNYFMSIDLSNFDFTKQRPITEFYKNLKESNISPIVKFLENELFIYHKIDNKDYNGNELYNKYNDYIKSNNYKYEMTSTKFGLEIKDYEGIIKKRTNKGISYNINFNILKNYLIDNNLIEPIQEDNNEINIIDSDEE
jgi:hypothetical protein